MTGTRAVDQKPGASRRAAAAWAVWLASGALWRTCRVIGVAGEHHVDALIETGKPFITCYWHEMQVFLAYYFVQLKRRRGLNTGFLISPSADGDIGAQVAQRWGTPVVRGSSTRTGARALKDCYEAVMRQDLVLAVPGDGPRGPRHELKHGAVMLAQLTGAPIVPFAYAASSAWRLNSWDRFLIPKPFSRIGIALGAPHRVEKRVSMEDQQRETAVLQEAMQATLIHAETMVRASE